MRETTALAKRQTTELVPVCRWRPGWVRELALVWVERQWLQDYMSRVWGLR